MDGFLSRESIYLAGGLAAVTAVLVLIVGLFGGVGLGLILLRMILFSLLLFVLGAGLGFLLQKFVPDIWDSRSSAAQPADEEGSGMAAGGGAPYGGGIDMTVGEDDFRPSPGMARADIPSGHEPAGDAGSVSGSAKWKKKDEIQGNYRIINEKKFPNDPEQYAKAVRTMLKKDD